VSRSTPASAAATVPQQGAFLAPPSLAMCSHKKVVDYQLILPLNAPITNNDCIFYLSCPDHFPKKHFTTFAALCYWHLLKCRNSVVFREEFYIHTLAGLPANAQRRKALEVPITKEE